MTYSWLKFTNCSSGSCVFAYITYRVRQCRWNRGNKQEYTLYGMRNCCSSLSSATGIARRNALTRWILKGVTYDWWSDEGIQRYRQDNKKDFITFSREKIHKSRWIVILKTCVEVCQDRCFRHVQRPILVIKKKHGIRLILLSKQHHLRYHFTKQQIWLMLYLMVNKTKS